MAVNIQIGDDPTKWWLVQPFNANQLTGQPLTLDIAAPIGGWMVLSGHAASVAVFDEPDATVPADVAPAGGTIYLPTAAGASAHNYGYGLVVNEALGGQNLAAEIAAAMHNGTRITIPLYGGGTLVINGATLDFVVINPASAGGASPHD
jgi:hypothetical protein